MDKQQPVESQSRKSNHGLRFSRRIFLKGSGTLVAGTLVAGCEVTPVQAPIANLSAVNAPGLNDKYLHVPPAPVVAPRADVRYFLTAAEATTLDALLVQILPGTPDDPGAREAGILTFIDYMLGSSTGWPEPTYLHGPQVRTYEGTSPPPEAAQTNPSEVVWVQKSELARYGFQTTLSVQEFYRRGLAALDSYVRGQYGSGLGDLGAADQAQVAKDLSEDHAAGFDEPGAKDFFHRVQEDTVRGLFGDPNYGGNRDFAGWKLVGYPGSHRAFTADDMHNERFNVAPQGLTGLDFFHTGTAENDHVIIPTAGSQGWDTPRAQTFLQRFWSYCQLQR
jgi:gluconate 2-dehydrogenase gamma chain